MPIIQIGSVAAVVIFLAAAAFTVVRPLTYHVNDAPWDAAVVAPDGRSLVLTFTGTSPDLTASEHCWQGFEPVAADAGDHVEVTLQRMQSFSARAYFTSTNCPTVGVTRTARVELATPLDGRAVLDASLRRDRPIFDGAHAAELTEPGATLTSEVTKPLTRGGVTLTRTYTLPDPPGSSLEVLQSPDRAAPTRGATSTPVEVHGEPAQLVEDRGTTSVEWEEQDQWIRISVTGDSLSQDELLSIAEGVRVP